MFAHTPRSLVEPHLNLSKSIVLGLCCPQAAFLKKVEQTPVRGCVGPLNRGTELCRRIAETIKTKVRKPATIEVYLFLAKIVSE